MPTMKSLDQVEARKIVNAANTPGDGTNTFIISTPGSYYLTSNITGSVAKNGVSIQANDVTLDLNGFSLVSGGGGNFRGIDVPAPQSGICVRNGTIRGWTDGGVRGEAATMLAERLRLADNTGARGLAVGNGSMILDCVASGNGTGFYAPDRTEVFHCISTVNQVDGFTCTSFVTVSDCTSSRNGNNGITVGGSTSVLRCNISRNSTDGIFAGAGCSVIGCTVGANLAEGISVGSGSSVQNCTVRANGAIGILAISSCQLSSNTCDSNHIGIQVTGNDNHVDGNHCTVDPTQNGVDGTFGFYIQGTNNWVVRNTARGAFAGTLVDQGFVFDNSASNAVGPLVRTTGGSISSTSPWANFRN